MTSLRTAAPRFLVGCCAGPDTQLSYPRGTQGQCPTQEVPAIALLCESELSFTASFSRGLDDRLVAFRLEVGVAFFVGLALFIGLCGFLDTRLPWPPRPSRKQR